MPPLWSLVNFLFPISRNIDICKYAKTYLLYTVFHLQELRFCFSFSLYSLSSPWFYFSYDFHQACHVNYYIFDHIQDRTRLVALWVFLFKNVLWYSEELTYFRNVFRLMTTTFRPFWYKSIAFELISLIGYHTLLTSSLLNS